MDEKVSVEVSDAVVQISTAEIERVVREAVMDEREACARIVEAADIYGADNLAAKIRERDLAITSTTAW